MAPAKTALQDNFAKLRSAARPTAIRLVNEADIREKTTDGQTLLFAAAGRPTSKGYGVDLCKLLRSRGLSATHKTSRNETALFEAVRAENLETATWFIENGCDVNAVNTSGTTPLCIAFYESQLEMVYLLLSHGANLDYQDNKGRRPVLYADPIFRQAFYAAQARGGVTIPAAKAPHSRKRLRSDREPEPIYKRFKGLGSEKCKGDYYLRYWVYPDEPHGDGGKIFPSQGKIYSAKNGFMVQVPPVTAAPKIRTLQRELCQDHSQFFPELILATCPGEWASFIGVQEEEIDAQERFVELLTDQQRPNACEYVLAGVDATTREILGYIHMQYYEAQQTIEIAYIKVQNSHRGLGLGRQLVDSSIQASLDRGWKFSQIRLTVNMRNTPAIKWYRQLGFKDDGIDTRKTRSMYRQWMVMKKKLPKEKRPANAVEAEEGTQTRQLQ